jgi:signal transduction histidine kinase
MSSRWRERLGRTFGFRLALWYAVVFVASALTLVVLTYALLALSLRQYDRQTIETTLVQYASTYARGGVDALAREIRRTQTAGTRGPLFVRALGARQDLVFLSMPEAWERFDLSQLAAPGLSGQQTWATLETGANGDTLEVASVRLRDGTLFQVGMSTERRTELLARFRQVLLFVSASILLVALAGGVVLTSSALQPLRALAGTVRQIMRTGRTDARVPVADTSDALGELSALFNAMLDRIDSVLAGMRGALDNVAHDLRTPMTRLRGIAEAGLRSNDSGVMREALADCVDESDRVVAMLSTLMDISEAETGTMRLEREVVHLADVVRQAVDLYEDAADHKGVAIAADTGADVRVLADRSRLRQVLANLLDNAVKYTPAGGRIDVRLEAHDAAAIVSVADTGVGIDPEEQPHIWERLYRGDKSRSARGLGLGLSLVKAIVEAHGGHVTVESTPGRGARFELHLPLAPSDLSAM